MKNNFFCKRALISVYNKKNIAKFAKKLHEANIEIISTGGTYKFLIDYGIPVIKIEQYTGFTEIMDGRLKTLHYKIHGGILGRRNKDEYIMSQKKILPIDMVIVNFYSINEIIAKKEKIEKFIDSIDIGGPTMVRSAAKNYKNVAVVTDENDYDNIIKELYKNKNFLTDKTKLKLAVKAFQYTFNYEKIIKDNFVHLLNKNIYIDKKLPNNFPKKLKFNLIKEVKISYGENMHQKSAFYLENNKKFFEKIKKIQGNNLSYNNIVDIDFALSFLKEFIDEKYVCVIIKHSNPCGVSIGTSNFDSYLKAYKTDPISAFGGTIAFSKELDIKTTKKIIKNQFVEIIISPTISKETLQFISHKKPKIKLVIYGSLTSYNKKNISIKSMHWGLLAQEIDYITITKNDLSIVSNCKPNEKEILDALFAWKVVKHVKSNAIVCVKNQTTVGIGSGQTSRIDATKFAIYKAKNLNLITKNCILASDGFLPFPDNVDFAAKYGIRCIIQPGGSIRDKEIISTANKFGLIMIFTGIRHFYH